MNPGVAVVRTPDLSRLPTGAHLSESTLVRGYSRGMPESVCEPCACGGLIVVDCPDDASIVAAVRSHNESAGHQAWRGEL